METIKATTYDITIQTNSFQTVLKTVSKFSVDTYHLLIDENVYAIYQDTIESAFDASHYTTTIIPTGEHSKSFSMVESTIETLIEKQIKRQDYLVAIGGGVIGDLTGFIASILFRGVDYIQVPTTLLAMVDSSVGGKTAINISKGKNLVGAFHSPKHVIIDPMFLSTLPKKEHRSGLSEMLKAGLIGDETIVTSLKASSEIDAALITRAIQVKLQYVKQDYLDVGLRHTLNFGHTYGHAIEQFYNYEISHGEAVAQGMILALKLGVTLGLTSQALCDEVITLIESLCLTKDISVDKKALMPYMKNDKKSANDTIRFVFLQGYQKPIIKSIVWEDLR
ncbi:MAG: 3-dehydroquinate synthase [Bacillota bacterium]